MYGATEKVEMAIWGPIGAIVAFCDYPKHKELDILCMILFPIAAIFAWKDKDVRLKVKTIIARIIMLLVGCASVIGIAFAIYNVFGKSARQF